MYVMIPSRLFLLLFVFVICLPSLPAAAQSDEDGDEVREAPSLGITPGEVVLGDVGLPTGASSTEIDTVGDLKAAFAGFLRIPLRIGVGEGVPGSDELELHTPPFIPDGTYTDWRYTNNLTNPWVELRFSYGSKRVAAHVLVNTFMPSDAAYNNLVAQLGINQAFLAFNLTDMFGRWGGLRWYVGAYGDRYGAAGQYDAGKYETYLFGRTRAAGETLNAFFNVAPNWQLVLEHGIGGKLDNAPVFNFDDEGEFPMYLPWAGPVQMLPTYVTHAHAGAVYKGKLQLTAHYLRTWTSGRTPQVVAGEDTMRNGSITTYGAEVKLTDHWLGHFYLGYSRTDTKDLARVAGAVELLHSIAGWNLLENYYGANARGNGHIDSVLFQYTLSLAKLLRHPEEFWGQGPDLLWSVFGMVNLVSSDESDLVFTGAERKLKYGTDIAYTPFEWLGVSARYDLVQPDMDNNTLSFHTISPRIFLRTSFAAHEQVTLQYTGYVYGDNVTPAWPADQRALDKHVVQLTGVMWW